ncbi:lipopolysaccharide biosynthesis protein [Streptomyces viridochromogenes]|uniref:Lipopolysaccharide biosynthesis protein n=1 Tax=Streptomyces viridochromogenes TaxID=1938 RepID=A0A0J7Z5B0_STRVR|nr:lipopolysaccharide biosynthesis protein [Streptomyces viridochromogenes]KMS70358.1 lipopolysaccharide biosynthesis protein [Streptomyces viridochromogenes]
MTDNPTESARVADRTRARVTRLASWWWLPAAALVGAVAGGAYGQLRPPQYTATSSVVAVPNGGTEADCTDALGFAQAYGRVATQLAVLGDAQVWAGVPVSTLRESVEVATSPDAPMVAVSATSSKPSQAVDIANAVSRALITEAEHTRERTGIRLERLSRALKPTEPSSASPALTSLVGASAGGLLGGLALLARPRRTGDDDEDEQSRASVPGPAGAADARGTLG